MNREMIICDIKAVTYYKDKDLIDKPTEQLFAMRNRIFAAIDKYYKEIFHYFHEHPEKRTMSDNDLKLLNYNDLYKLRNSLGLGRKKVTKKVDGTELAKKARSHIKKKEIKELSVEIIKAQEEYDTQECMLYMDEIIQMGYGDYTREELMSIGIIPLDYEESHLKK